MNSRGRHHDCRRPPGRSGPHSTLLDTRYLPALIHAWMHGDRYSPRFRSRAGLPRLGRHSPVSPRSPSGSQPGGGPAPRTLVRRISSCFDGLIQVAETARRRRPEVPRATRCSSSFAAIVTNSAPPGRLRTCSGRSSRSAAPRAPSAPVELRMSAGVHSGECFSSSPSCRTGSCSSPDRLRPGSSTRGSGRTGEIVLSAETAAAVDPAWLGEEREGDAPDASPGARSQHVPAAAVRSRRRPRRVRTAPD
jgi:hypothetical protein